MSEYDNNLEAKASRIIREIGINRSGFGEPYTIPFDEILPCILWINLNKESLFLNKPSFKLIPLIERWADARNFDLTSASNGALIVAALICGYEIIRIGNSQAFYIVKNSRLVNFPRSPISKIKDLFNYFRKKIKTFLKSCLKSSDSIY